MTVMIGYWCEYCGVEFTREVKAGQPPRYCNRSHRQRAYEQRRAAAEEEAAVKKAIKKDRRVRAS